MAPKKYTNGRKQKREGGNEVLGIGLIIASAFILLCIVIPPLIGIVSQAVNGLITGIFGFISYPLFFGLLVLGIALLQGWRVSLPGKYIAAISVMAFSIVMILQLAVTNSLMDFGFSEYISNVYSLKSSACGVFFGVIAYGMKAGLSRVFSYILLSAVVIGMTLILMGFGKNKGLRFKKKKSVVQEPPKYKFVKGESAPHPVQPVTDNSLFVESIVPAQKTEAGSFNTLTEGPKPSASGYSNETPVFQSYNTADVYNYGGNAYNKAADSYNKPMLSSGYAGYDAPATTPSVSKKDARSEAHRILFEENRSNFPFYEPEPPKASLQMPDILSSEPAIKSSSDHGFTKPPKIVHADSAPAALPFDVVFPEPKDISDQIVGGTIINGDDLSMRLMEQRAASENANKSTENGRPRLEDFSVKKLEPEALKPIEPPPAPIMNGDLYTEALLRKQSETVLRSDKKVDDAKASTEFSARADTPLYKGTESETPEPAAIKEVPETSFEQLLKDERAIRDREIVEPETLTLPGAEESLAPIVNADALTSAFKIEDEVIDLSETSSGPEKDFTGYYEPVKEIRNSFSEVSDRGSRKSRIMPNQINLDDYGRNVPEEEAPKPAKKKKRYKYVAPPIDLLLNNSTNPEDYGGDSQEKARILEQTLESLKLPAKVVQITKGPAVTRYELEMQPGIPIKRIESFQSDIAYNLASNGKIRIETPIPGKRAVGVEVPNEQIAIVALRDIIESKQFQSSTSPLTLSLGKDIAGQNIVCQLEKMPHLLIAGSTGSGKSACLNSIIMSILYKASPEEVRLILIDPKEVEFAIYKDMPHLLIKDIINDTEHAVNAFKWAKMEMDRRYKLLSRYCVRSLAEFNNSQAVKDGLEEKLPRIVIIVDELCELIMSPAKKELEERIMSMAQKARAAGLHLILATQRPSVDVITGTIKANLPSRVAFAVTSYNDSRTILDQGGAESLLGRGDMLYAPNDMPEPKRVQGAYVTTEEVATIVGFVKEHNPCDYDDDVESDIMFTKEAIIEKNPDDDEDDDGFDVLMKQVLKRVITSGQASTSMIQRRFSVGYARASRIIDQMESNRFIGPLEGSKPREVYITREQFRELFGEDVDEVS